MEGNSSLRRQIDPITVSFDSILNAEKPKKRSSSARVIRSGSEDRARPRGEINPVLRPLMWSADAKRHIRLWERDANQSGSLRGVCVCVCVCVCVAMRRQYAKHAFPPQLALLPNSFQSRMMSLLALQRSNQSPACLKGPARVIRASESCLSLSLCLCLSVSVCVCVCVCVLPIQSETR